MTITKIKSLILRDFYAKNALLIENSHSEFRTGEEGEEKDKQTYVHQTGDLNPKGNKYTNIIIYINCSNVS